MKPIVIGLIGKAHSGKDTVGDWLVEQHNFYAIAFADYPKRMLRNLYDLSYDQLWGDDKEEIDTRYNVTPRYIMQYWLQACRHIDSDIWIRAVDKQINPVLSGGSPVVITDVRFPDEVKLVQKHNGYLIEVRRDGAQANGGIPYHASEQDLHVGQFIIDNNSTLEVLFNEVDHLLESINDSRQ